LLRKWEKREEGVDWVRVKSKMLAAVAYNRDWRQLFLKFRSGDVYCYWGVPFEVHQELLAAESKGQYARAHILNRYPNQRVHSAVCAAS
jgi:KTSC domain-containing protein